MSVLILSFLTSLVVTLLVVRSSDSHARLSADFNTTGPQKFHARPVPRVGGVGMLCALLASACLLQWRDDPAAKFQWLLIATGSPAFISGLAEDLVKTMSPRRRLFFTAVSAGLAIWLLDGLIKRTDIPGIDALLTLFPFAVAMTLFVVTGVANSVNIIDGFNGLASMCVLMMLLALAYVADLTGDNVVLALTLATVGAVLGFFLWNYPAGLIFMGDGGAYFLGFLLAELSLLLLNRNLAVSPMFPLLLCAYPIFETIFTMYRRKVVRGVAVGAPDGIHLHTLVHRRSDPLGQRRIGRAPADRAQLDDVALSLAALPEFGDTRGAVVEQHADPGHVPGAVHGRLRAALLEHRPVQDAEVVVLQTVATAIRRRSSVTGGFNLSSAIDYALTKVILTRFPIAPAAFTSVCSVVAGLSGLRSRSSCARVVPIRLAMAVLVSWAFCMPRSSSKASTRLTATA